jgi:acyl transferase domain-containing protein/NAD(P)-dependent dehydrogenase (short-subunit alcohol dehydrogenase family)/acyl carrier protein
MGCRFPGGVNDPESLWRLLSSGGDAIVDVPSDRWSSDRFYSDDPTVPGKTYVRRGGFLHDPIDRFDPLFFGISPREAQHMDPQQRLLLEVAWEALEEAGMIPGELAGSSTGVYVGGFALDAMTILMSPYGRTLLDTHHAATAASMTMLSARVSYIFDFRGPSVTMDTACSSSLVALHYACRGLIERECDMALAGGVNVMISAEYPIIMSKGHFLARDGHCKSFDAKADGYSRGEGCGLVVLKRLDDALRDGDRIRAIIEGTGVNQDGRTDGITVPSADAQEALIRAVYAKAEVPLSAVRYVEAHGTGTPVGDPLEATALGRTFGAGRGSDSALIIGSIKANIGHLEAAAGVAGVIKAVLCLEHGRVPQQIHLDEPNPAIAFADLGLKLPLVPLELAAPPGESLYAGVNSFGYGGTNAHAVLRAHALEPTLPAARPGGGAVLLPISARTEGALRLMAARFAAALSDPEGAPLDVFAATAALERSHFDHRLAVQGSSPAELAQRLTAFVAEGAADGVVVGRSRTGRLAFVFSGMGPQWWAMGQTLLETEPVFCAAAEECDRIFTRIAGWSILTEMRRSEAESRMSETRIAQPANFVLQVALAALLGDLGVMPEAVVGHSVGEVAAAYVSGALDLEDAIRVVYHRSRLQQTTAGSGTMLAVGLGAADVASRLVGHTDLVSLAAVNSSRSVTLAGDAAALGAIAEALEDEGVFHRFLHVEVPYHSPLMEPLRAELLASLAGLRPSRPTLPLYSTVTGALWDQSALHDAGYWFRNLRDPVLFAAALDALISDGHGLFAEIGPHPVLSSAIRDGLTARGATGDSVYSLHRKSREADRILTMAAELYTLGFAPDWRRINGEPVRGTRIPTYQWDRDRFWVENAAMRNDRLGHTGHPILGMPMPVATGSMWTADLNANYVPWLADHQVDEATVFPGAGYVEACLAMHAALDGSDPAIIENLDLTRALVLEPAAGTELQWTFDSKTRACTAASRAHGSDGAWQTHAAATILASVPWAVPALDAAAIAARCPLEIDVAALYAALKARGLNYGPAFQCVRELRLGSAEVLARLALSDRDAAAAERYRVHPAMLDAAFQALIAACRDAGSDSTLFMPVGMRQIQFHAPVGAHAYAHCRLVAQTAEGIEGDVTLCATDGTVLLEVKGVRCVGVGQRGKGDGIPLDRWMYNYTWELSEPAAGFAEPARWLVFSDEGVGPALTRYLRNQGADAVIEVVPGEAYACLEEERFQVRRGSADDMATVLAASGAAGCRGIIYLWGADPVLNDAAVDPTGLTALGDVITLVKALCAEPVGDDDARPRLYVATREAQHVDETRPIGGLNAAALVGFMRVVAIETPELRATLVDLDPQTALAASGRRLGQEILSGSEEDDVALRGSNRYVHRLMRRSEPRAAETLVPLTELGREAAYRLEIGVTGSLEKVRYAEVPRRAPGENEIELRIQAVGLNFKDVLKVLGMLSESTLEGTHYGSALGMEASAMVVAVGPGVTEYSVGDEIVALVAGSLASHLTIRTDQLLSAKRPAGMSAAQGATIPIAFMTAYYGLVEAARLRPGEKVLIHAGAGGVGMAAIAVAKWIGAEIYATAGSAEKRDLLLSLGVSRVWSSRTLEFVDGIREATAGRGVDVVLNSLSGEAMERSFEALAPLGRFIEIGKRDILERSRLPMAAFDRSVSFTALDLDRLTLTNLDAIIRLFGDTWKHIESGAFAPLPLTRFGAAEISDALRYMVAAKQVGKIVVDFEDETNVAILPLAVRRELVRDDASYLVTGAFGGVGAELVRLLVDAGARHLVLAGRSGAQSPAAVALLAEIRERGVVVREARIDVADKDAVETLLGEVAVSMPALRGVFHAAAVLDDALIANLDAQRVAAVMTPKARGAWVLHEATQGLELDCFVLFSSATSLMGNPGQSSYVAANAFLDALASQRHAHGLPATAINWGAIGDVGMLAADNAATRGLERAGVYRIPVASAMAALPRVIGLDAPAVAVMDVDWAKWTAVFPVVKNLPRFSVLAAEDASANAGADYRTALLALPAAERLPVLTAAMIGLVADALHLPPEKVDRYQPLTDLGIDSLVGVELQASISAKLGLQISILQLMKGGNIEEMAVALLAKMTSGGGGSGATVAPPPVTVETPAVVADGGPDSSGNEQIAA